LNLTSSLQGECDGLREIAKWVAVWASLQRNYADQIITPRQLSDMAQTTIMNINFIEFVTKLEFTDKNISDCYSVDTYQLVELKVSWISASQKKQISCEEIFAWLYWMLHVSATRKYCDLQ
jgi:hypothetical protein